MSEAATSLGVSAHVIRRLIRDGVLPAEQVVPDAPWHIQAADLQHPRVVEALATRHGPRRAAQQNKLLKLLSGSGVLVRVRNQGCHEGAQ